MNLAEYVVLARQRRGLRSDRQLAKVLGISHNTVVHWRYSRCWPTEDNMLELAALAGVDQERALLDLSLWRTKSEGARTVYAKMADRLRQLASAKIVTVLAALILAALLAAPDANATATKAQSSWQSNYYEKLWRLVLAIFRVQHNVRVLTLA